MESSLYFLALLNEVSTSNPGKFFVYALKNFFVRYAEGSYYDAAVWGRRLAEVYCKFVLQVFAQGGEGNGLYELIPQLPEWAWQHTAYDHLYAYGEGGFGRRFGMQYAVSQVWEDLESLRKYGNRGAHAADEYLAGAKLPPSPRVVVCVVRVALSFICWYRRIHTRDSIASINLRSML